MKSSLKLSSLLINTFYSKFTNVCKINFTATIMYEGEIFLDGSLHMIMYSNYFELYVYMGYSIYDLLIICAPQNILKFNLAAKHISNE